jgi:uncharacterized protein YciI
MTLPSNSEDMRMTHQNRRHFIGMSLAASSGLAAQAHAATDCSAAVEMSATSNPIYLVAYRHGPSWAAGKPMAQQAGLGEHFNYWLEMYRNGRLRSAGGFTDESGGAAIFEATDDDAAAAVIAADPAVVSGVFSHELKRWRPNPWAEILKKRAARRE